MNGFPRFDSSHTTKLTLLNKKQMNKRKFTHEDFNMIIGMTTIAGLIIYNIVANGIMLS